MAALSECGYNSPMPGLCLSYRNGDVWPRARPGMGIRPEAAFGSVELLPVS
jgi:hypothetical protein